MHAEWRDRVHPGNLEQAEQRLFWALKGDGFSTKVSIASSVRVAKRYAGSQRAPMSNAIPAVRRSA